MGQAEARVMPENKMGIFLTVHSGFYPSPESRCRVLGVLILELRLRLRGRSSLRITQLSFGAAGAGPPAFWVQPLKSEASKPELQHRRWMDLD